MGGDHAGRSGLGDTPPRPLAPRRRADPVLRRRPTVRPHRGRPTGRPLRAPDPGGVGTRAVRRPIHPGAAPQRGQPTLPSGQDPAPRAADRRRRRQHLRGRGVVAGRGAPGVASPRPRCCDLAARLDPSCAAARPRERRNHAARLPRRDGWRRAQPTPPGVLRAGRRAVLTLWRAAPPWHPRRPIHHVVRRLPAQKPVIPADRTARTPGGRHVLRGGWIRCTGSVRLRFRYEVHDGPVASADVVPPPETQISAPRSTSAPTIRGDPST